MKIQHINLKKKELRRPKKQAWRFHLFAPNSTSWSIEWDWEPFKSHVFFFFYYLFCCFNVRLRCLVPKENIGSLDLISVLKPAPLLEGCWIATSELRKKAMAPCWWGSSLQIIILSQCYQEHIDLKSKTTCIC